MEKASVDRFQVNRDFASGLLFFAFGAGAVLVARGYPFGAPTQMGAGFFPVVIGALLMLLGGVLSLVSFRKPADFEPLTLYELRALGVILAVVVLFGLVIESWGLVISVVLLSVLSRLAGRDGSIRELAAVTAVLVCLAIGIFIYGLRLPIPVGFW
jgi:hypothetical protein